MHTKEITDQPTTHDAISRRDYYTGLAMQALITKDWPHDEVAEEAISIADTVIGRLGDFGE